MGRLPRAPWARGGVLLGPTRPDAVSSRHAGHRVRASGAGCRVQRGGVARCFWDHGRARLLVGALRGPAWGLHRAHGVKPNHGDLRRREAPCARAAPSGGSGVRDWVGGSGARRRGKRGAGSGSLGRRECRPTSFATRGGSETSPTPTRSRERFCADLHPDWFGRASSKITLHSLSTISTTNPMAKPVSVAKCLRCFATKSCLLR